MTERFKILPAVCLILKKDNKILLHQRRNTGYCDYCYGLIGGGVDGNETLFKALIREAKEEIGIALEEKNLNLVHILHYKSNFESITFFIEATKWEGIPMMVEPDKCTDLRWFDMNNLPSNLVDHLSQTLNKINKGIFYSEWGWE